MSGDPLTIVAFGDSITNGAGAFGVTGATAFRGLVKARLAEALAREVVVLNAGVNGDIAPQALERLERDVLAPQPDIVTVMFGVNDAGYYRPATNGFADTPRVELPHFRQCMAAITDRILESGARAILLTPLPMNRHYWGKDLAPYVQNGLNYLVRQYAQASREVAAERRVPLVDTYAWFESHPETEDLVPDGIHPNPDGHRLIADLLFPALLDTAQAILTPGVQATDVRFEDNQLIVSLSDGREISVPMDKVEWLGWLARATPQQRERWTIEPGGYAVYWDELDDGIEICHLLAMQPLG